MLFKILDSIRKIGKYVAMAACMVAVAHGFIYWKLFCPMEVSMACIFGIILWAIGRAGMFMLTYYDKYLAGRAGAR